MKHVSYLGFLIGETGIHCNRSKIKAINKIATPTSIEEVCQFNGMCSYYCKFISHYSDISKCFNDMTRKGATFNWTKECDAAFKLLKEKLMENPVLISPQVDKDYVIHCDASKYIVFQFVVPQRHRGTALDGCHREVAHQGQCRSIALMQEHFWWPSMTRDLRNCIKKCSHCKKYEAASPVVPMKPLTCSGLGELLHVDFTSIEETVPLKKEPVIRNVLVLQDHFSKYVVVYVVKDQTACTTTETPRIGYFRLFGAPAYLVSDQGKAFMGHVITHLCELYGVQKLRTSPYHAQTNGQVERMNQTIICMAPHRRRSCQTMPLL